jgi:hypothetical protein
VIWSLITGIMPQTERRKAAKPLVAAGFRGCLRQSPFRMPSPRAAVWSGACWFRDCVELEADFVGHELKARDSRDRIAEGLLCVVGDYESLDRLAGHGQMGSDVPHVPCGLADDFV